MHYSFLESSIDFSVFAAIFVQLRFIASIIIFLFLKARGGSSLPSFNSLGGGSVSSQWKNKYVELRHGELTYYDQGEVNPTFFDGESILPIQFDVFF